MSVGVISILVTIALSLIGLAATYANSIRLDKRRERLALVDQRLNEFYGPLYVSTIAGAMAFDALQQKLGSRPIYRDREKNSPEVFNEWRIWLAHVFMPLNDLREGLILEKAHLIREEEMPECLLRFVAHNAAYKAVLKKWEEKDFSEHLSVIDFPVEIQEYATRSYQELKREQMRLIGGSGGSL
jgi:hypothetical protein